MKTVYFAAVAALLFIVIGCNHNNVAPRSCPAPGLAAGANGPANVGQLPPGYFNNQPAGPQSPTTAYPYYTLRAPRDFLSANPPSIGL
jgi:hypothetical protein